MSDDKESDETLPALGQTGRDRAVAWVQALAGITPAVGSVLSEIIGQLIPEQRQERLEAYVILLEKRLHTLEQDTLRDKLTAPEKINLFEEGAFQAARSLSPDRTAYIASIVSTGLAGEEKEEIEAKRMLRILSELEDDQIIVLAAHLQKNRTQEFQDKHAAVLRPVAAHMRSSQDERDKAVLQQVAKQHMVGLGLLRPRFKRPKRGELPEFDEQTGMMKATGHQITPLGRLLLRYTGLSAEGDM